jgi:WD40 repeat protein
VEINCSQRLPYPGLRPFTEAESDLFFGREKHIAQLRTKLENNRFVAVVGTSGSGKSSLVRAGLIAELKGLRDRDSGEVSRQDSQLRWRVAEMRPSGSPVAALARALVSHSAIGPERAALFSDLPIEKRKAALEGDTAFVAATLRRGPLGLVEVLNETPLLPDTRLLLFVDQFEELFRFRNEGPSNTPPDVLAKCLGRGARERWVNEAEAFVALLLETVGRADLDVHLLLTMRLDYLADCATFSGLPEAINASQFLIPRLTREQRGASIVAPARLCGGDVAPDLVNTLLNETGPESDQLPLLQHCLMRMWAIAHEEHVPGHNEWLLTMEHYRDERVGTLKSCLSNHANGIYTDLQKQNARCGMIAETVFRCLTAHRADKLDTRRPQPWAALRSVVASSGDSEADLRLVLDAFRDQDCSFLTPPLDTELLDSTPIDISHESLMRNWPRLQDWVKAEAASADDYRSLARSARHWKKGCADLLDRLALESILDWKKREKPSAEWAVRYGGDFSLAMEFLERSQKSERERCCRRVQRRIAALVLVLLVGGTFGWFIFDRLKEKTELLDRAKKRSDHFLSLAQARLVSPDPKKDVVALHYLSRALHVDPGNAEAARLAIELLSGNIWCSPATTALHSNSDNPLLCATFGPNGQVFAVSSDGNLLSWRENGSALLNHQQLFSGNDSSPTDKNNLTAAFFSRDSKRVLVLSAPVSPNAAVAKAEVWEWFAPTNRYQLTSSAIEIKNPSTYYQIAWSGDERVLVVIPMRWNSTSCQVFRYDGKSYQEIPNPFEAAKVAAACFSPDNKWLATVSPEGGVKLWDAATLEPATETAQVKGEFQLLTGLRPNSLAFGPGKDELLVTVFGQSAQILNMRTGELKQVRPPRGQDQIMRLVLAPEQASNRLAASAFNGRVQISQVSALDEPITEPICFQGAIALPTFSRDGKKILILSGPYWKALDTVQVWDTELQEPLPKANKLKFDGGLAPLWLADVAEVESGTVRWSSDDEGAPQTLEDIRKKYPRQNVRGKYEVIWRRFFSDQSGRYHG